MCSPGANVPTLVAPLSFYTYVRHFVSSLLLSVTADFSPAWTSLDPIPAPGGKYSGPAYGSTSVARWHRQLLQLSLPLVSFGLSLVCVSTPLSAMTSTASSIFGTVVFVVGGLTGAGTVGRRTVVVVGFFGGTLFLGWADTGGGERASPPGGTATILTFIEGERGMGTVEIPPRGGFRGLVYISVGLCREDNVTGTTWVPG